MEFKILIDQFEGPLDLMLHLIKENKLDLFDLDMNVLTDQYLAYLETMEILHLEIASEYLSELAALLEYKSKKLLPREKVEVSEEYEEDHRDRLVARLLEYQRFKEISETLRGAYEQRQMKMEKPLSEETARWMREQNDEQIQGSPYELIKAMRRVLHRLALAHPYETKMKVNELSVDDRLAQIQERLKDWNGKMSFIELCQDCRDVHMVIVTFLSILELIKHHILHFHIDEEEMIWIIKGEDTHESMASNH